MKLKLSIILLALITLLTSCDVFFKPDATSVAITSSVSKVQALGSTTLTASVLPLNASQSVTWSSSDSTIATISDAGVVSGLKPGKVTITAKSGLKSTTKTLYVGYENDFSIPGSWTTGTTIGAGYEIRRAIDDGVLQNTIVNSKDYLFTNLALYTTAVDSSLNVKLNAPYEVETDITFGTQTGGYITSSIIFNFLWTDSSNYSYYFAGITADGHYCVKKFNFVNGSGSTENTVQYTPLSSINLNTKNTIKIQQSLTDLKLIINGTTIGTYPITATAVQQIVGLGVTEKTSSTTHNVITTFDNFKVYPID